MRTIKRRLERTRYALTNAIASGMTESRERPERREVVKDPYGAASLTHDDEVAVAMVEQRARELEEIDRALEDIEAGRYGICRECGEPIAPARLKVLPFATRCVSCQAEHEGARRAA